MFAIIHSTQGDLWIANASYQLHKIDFHKIIFSDGEHLLEKKDTGGDVIHEFSGEAAVLIDNYLIAGPKEWVDSIGAEILAIRPGRARVWTKKRARCACVDADEAVRMLRE